MRSKEHTAPTVPLVLHRTRIEKYATKKFIINGQWRNRFSLVKAPMNAPGVCKLRNNCLTVINQCAIVLKGQCHEIFCFWFFSWISFPQASDYTIRAVSNFFRKFAEIFAAQGLPQVWQMEKTFKQKNFNHFVWTPLGNRVNIYCGGGINNTTEQKGGQ